MNYIIRRHNDKSKGGNFNSGKKAVTIDDRTGFKQPYTEMVFEPGTNYWVHEDESDRDYSLVSHPQNYPPSKQTEKIALRNPSPDTLLSIGTIVCIRDLFTGGGNYITSANTFVSNPTGASTGAWIFDLEINSMYIFQVF